jgi:hypothetical protein
MGELKWRNVYNSLLGTTLAKPEDGVLTRPHPKPIRKTMPSMKEASAGVLMTLIPDIHANHFSPNGATVHDVVKIFTTVNVRIATQNPAGAPSVVERMRTMSRKCVSYDEKFGECGMDYDEDDVDDDGYPLECPSSCDDGYCMDDGEEHDCNEFYSEDE